MLSEVLWEVARALLQYKVSDVLWVVAMALLGGCGRLLGVCWAF